MNIIDLSHYIAEDMPLFPGTPPLSIKEVSGMDDVGYRVSQLIVTNHIGTHIDAPRHMIEDGAALDELPISRFFGLALTVDVSGFGGKSIPAEFLQAHEEMLAHVQFLVLKTNWDKYWGQDAYMRDYPLLSPEAARYLCGFSLSGVAMDCVSLDPVEGEQAIHHILLGAGMISVENLTNLDQISGSLFLLSALPLKWRLSNGSPVRAAAYEAPAGIYYPS